MLIPRLNMAPKDDDYPFMWRRRQFPVHLAFAMTVNKSQGQTFTGRVGLFLPEPVFGHGQFYVACSRTVSPDNMRVCVMHDPPVVVARPHHPCEQRRRRGGLGGYDARDGARDGGA